MAEKTKIAWADGTWNPWSGCWKVSEGCAHCYMFREKAQYGQNPTEIRRASSRTFRSPLTWSPRVIFVCSWSDFFIEVADPWRAEAWELMRRARGHFWLLLTKRPQNIEARLPRDWPWPNVGLGVTTENQYRFDERWGVLRRIPAALHYVSVEPILDSIVGFRGASWDVEEGGRQTAYKLGWVIVGGESGPEARPVNPEWVRIIRDQCASRNIPFCFKQWGEWRRADGISEESYYFNAPLADGTTGGRISRDVVERGLLRGIPGVGTFVRVGKKAAGKELDGRIWDERPEVITNWLKEAN